MNEICTEILLPLENEVIQLEEKARARIGELESVSTKKQKIYVKEQTCKETKKEKLKLKEQTSEETRRSERKRKQPVKLKESADFPNHLTHVGTIVDVLWTE